MKFDKAAYLLALILISQLLPGCGNSPNSSNASNVASDGTNSESANTSRTNVEELGVLIQMPFETEEAVWKEIPSQKKLLAVLRLSPADADRLVEQAKAHRPPTSVAVSSETWFPPELIAQVDVSGDSSLKGTSYGANDFYQPPYTEGQLTRIDGTEYFMLEMTAK
jgi:hypothetical protein